MPVVLSSALGWVVKAVNKAAKATTKVQRNNQHHWYLTNLGLNPKKRKTLIN
jgi:hypothetical protein